MYGMSLPRVLGYALSLVRVIGFALSLARVRGYAERCRAVLGHTIKPLAILMLLPRDAQSRIRLFLSMPLRLLFDLVGRRMQVRLLARPAWPQRRAAAVTTGTGDSPVPKPGMAQVLTRSAAAPRPPPAHVAIKGISAASAHDRYGI
jgi:hypothetical protein